MQKHMRCAGAALLAAAFLLLGGCATMSDKSVEQSDEAYRSSLAEADAVAAKNDTETAVAAYRKVATDNPSRDEPWVRIGQLRFSKGDYSLAIVAAEEALKRDPANQQAKSIHAVGGLRLAMRSLEDMRKEGPLTGDAAADAQRLATVLRETLGQKNLIADTADEAPPPRPVRRARAPRPAASAEGAAPAPQARPAGGNPLDAFK